VSAKRDTLLGTARSTTAFEEEKRRQITTALARFRFRGGGEGLNFRKKALIRQPHE